MLKLFDLHNTLLGVFDDYQQLHEFLVKHQAHEASHLPSWNFVHYRHYELSILYSGLSPDKLSAVEEYALSRGVGLIALTQGDPRYPVQIPLTLALNVNWFIQDWCRRYCSAHKLLVVTVKEGEELDHDLVI